MGLDATTIGIQLFFLVLLPGFMFFVSFRWAAGFKEKIGEAGSLFGAAIFGGLLWSLFEKSKDYNVALLNNLLSTPIGTGLSLAACGIIFGVALGLILRMICSIPSMFR